MTISRRIFISSHAKARFEKLHEALAGTPSAARVRIVAPHVHAGNVFLRETTHRRGALFGWERTTLHGLGRRLAERPMARAKVAPLSALGFEALCARVAHRLRAADKLGELRDVVSGPQFARALARTARELRDMQLGAHSLEGIRPDVRALYAELLRELHEGAMADRADVMRFAAANDSQPGDADALVFVDVPLDTESEVALVRSLALRCRAVFVALPAGDTRSLDFFSRALESARVEEIPYEPVTRLERLQSCLFASTHGANFETVDPESVVLFNAPGEGRECVEIARAALRCIAEGTPLERIAVSLRAGSVYRPHVEQAFRRARIPAFFAEGTRRPDPGGRALLALLACSAEGLSAKRFAEYLSLGEVPDAMADGAPPAPLGEQARWVAPSDERAVEEGLDEAPDEEKILEASAQVADPSADVVTAGRLRSPRHWEKLLVDAAVLGGKHRWHRRLEGLRRELELDRAILDDPEGPQAQLLDRRTNDLRALQAFALPLIENLAELPTSATWGEWLESLAKLATRALRHPTRVLALLAELAPMKSVGPVDLREVRLVLSRRLSEITAPPTIPPQGAVYVSSTEAIRGLSFDVVFVPGLAERVFPEKLIEDPLLRDDERSSLHGRLVKHSDRVARERLHLRIAVGAATKRVVLSYPRVDLDQARPRVPSFYALEAVRAATGALPSFEELAQRAEATSRARIGWPAPARPEDAIDDAEHDLALLDAIFQRPENETVGMANYLLQANEHLARALRFRARRWRRRWSSADGLLDIAGAARLALDAHKLAARSYSPTALEKYARCPYAFALHAIHRLEPREDPAPIEEMDALQRGSLMHTVQFRLLTELRSEGRLPITPKSLALAHERLDEVLDAVARDFHDELAPAIERVWDDSIAQLRADLREWLRRMADDQEWVPWRFELAFGLPPERGRDEASKSEPARLPFGLNVRGSIDLVERRSDGTLRATDYKSGKARVKQGEIVSGGEALQPVLYALVLEHLFPEVRIQGSRLYYCTSRGGFEEASLELGEVARESAKDVAYTVGDAIDKGFLPAAPAKGACQWCDYQCICGPYEEMRAARKPQKELEPLVQLRSKR